MPKTVFTTTISLPKSMAASLRRMRREESRTTSELVREALRHYERMHSASYRQGITWSTLRARLKKTSRAGRTVNLAGFIAKDRLSH